MFEKKTLFKIFEMGGDYVAIFFIFNLSYWIRYKIGFFSSTPHPYKPYLDFSFVVSIFGIISLNMTEIYNVKKLTDKLDLFLFTVKAMSLTAVFSMVTSYIIKGHLTGGIINFSRIVIATSWIINIIVIYFLHRFYESIIRYFRKKGIGLNNVLIIGTGREETYFWEFIKNNRNYGYSPVGFLDDSDENIEKEMEGKKILGNIGSLKNVLINHNIDEVVLSNPSIPKDIVLHIKSICDKFETKITIIPNIYGLITYPTKIYNIGNIPLFSLEDKILLKYNKIIKRCFDIIFSITGLVLLSPFLLFIALLIKITSKGPVFFKQERLGRGEKPFQIYKFRTMIEGAEKQIDELMKFNEMDGPIFKIKRDPRCTRIGRFLRKFSIDEIPQFINVIKGDMSLVGPRPCLRLEANNFKIWHMRKFDVRPGITGLAQVNGRSSIKDFDRVINLDIYYIENWSFWMDIKIMLKTIPAIVLVKGAC